MSPLDWVGPVTGLALVAIVAAVRAAVAAVRGLRAVRRYRLDELADLSRDDVDPGWPDVRQTLGTPQEK